MKKVKKEIHTVVVFEGRATSKYLILLILKSYMNKVKLNNLPYELNMLNTHHI